MKRFLCAGVKYDVNSYYIHIKKIGIDFKLLLLFLYFLFISTTLSNAFETRCIFHQSFEIKPYIKETFQKIRRGSVVKDRVFEPIQGARIKWSESNESVYTDKDGNFELPEYWTFGSLEISANGYEIVEYALYEGGLSPDRTRIILYQDVSKVPQIHIGDTIPLDFWNIPITVVNDTLNRSILTLKEYHDLNSLIILSFWATWCSPCINSLNEWNTGLNNIKSGAKIIGIHVGRQTDKVLALAQQNRWTFPIIVGENRVLSKHFFSSEVPLGYFVFIKNGKFLGVPQDKSFSESLINDIINDIKVSFESNERFLWKGGTK